MKNILSSCTLLALWAVIPYHCFSQSIKIFYYAPTEDIKLNFANTNPEYVYADYCDQKPTGYSYVLLDRNTVPVFRKTAPSLMRLTYDSLTRLNSDIRKRVLDIVTLSDGTINEIEINLYNDLKSFDPHAISCMSKRIYPFFAVSTKTHPTIDGDTLDWVLEILNEPPERKLDTLIHGKKGICLWGKSVLTKAGSNVGYVQTGELFALQFWQPETRKILQQNELLAGDFNAAYFGFLFDAFLKTQFVKPYKSEIERFWGIRNPIGNIYKLELGINYPFSSFENGLANFIGLDRNSPLKDSIINFLNRGDYRFFLQNDCPLSKISDLWNAPHKEWYNAIIPDDEINIGKLRISRTSKNSRLIVRAYKWLDTPAKYVFENEMMVTGYFAFIQDYAFINKSVAYEQILDAIKEVTPEEKLRHPAFMANVLANKVEARAATPEESKWENSMADAISNASSRSVSSMFVYALYDILTHFGMTTQELKAEFSSRMEPHMPVQQPKAFDYYWAYRDRIKAIASPYLGYYDEAALLKGVDQIDLNNPTPEPIPSGKIDIVKAVQEVRQYLQSPEFILKQ